MSGITENDKHRELEFTFKDSITKTLMKNGPLPLELIISNLEILWGSSLNEDMRELIEIYVRELVNDNKINKFALDSQRDLFSIIKNDYMETDRTGMVLVIKAEINGLPLKSLIDTNSSFTLISKEMMEKLNWPEDSLSLTEEIHDLNRDFRIHGRFAEIKFQRFNNKTVYVPAFVYSPIREQYNVDMLLGRNAAGLIMKNILEFAENNPDMIKKTEQGWFGSFDKKIDFDDEDDRSESNAINENEDYRDEYDQDEGNEDEFENFRSYNWENNRQSASETIGFYELNPQEPNLNDPGDHRENIEPLDFTDKNVLVRIPLIFNGAQINALIEKDKNESEISRQLANRLGWGDCKINFPQFNLTIETRVHLRLNQYQNYHQYSQENVDYGSDYGADLVLGKDIFNAISEKLSALYTRQPQLFEIMRSAVEIKVPDFEEEKEDEFFGALSSTENFISRKISLQFLFTGKKKVKDKNGNPYKKNAFFLANKEESLKELKRFRDLTVIHRDFANQIITHIFKTIESDPDRGIEDFADIGTYAPFNVYISYHISNLTRQNFKNKKYSDRFNLSERFKRSTTGEVYFLLHNWFVRKGNLIQILNILCKIMKIEDLKLFLLKGNLENQKLRNLKAGLGRDIFKRPQNLSNEYLKNHLSQIKNIIFKEKKLDNSLNLFFSNLINDQKRIENNAKEVLTSLIDTKKDNDNLNDLKFYFVKIFFTNLKTKCTRVFKSKSKVILDPLVHFLVDGFKNSHSKDDIKEFKKYINDIIDPIKESFNESQISEREWKDLAIEAIKEEINKILSNEDNNYVSKQVFSPNFSPIRFNELNITDLNFEDFKDYVKMKMRYQFRDQLSEIINVNTQFLDVFFRECKRISQNINNYLNKPKIKELTIKLNNNNSLWDVIYDQQSKILRFKFKPLVGVKNFFNFTLSMQDLKDPERFGYTEPSDIDRIFHSPPTLQIERRKIILLQPFKKSNSENFSRLMNSSDLGEKYSNIIMGIDLGLKDYAVISIIDEKTKLEFARYFLDQKAVFNRKFDINDGKFKPINFTGNIGNKLYNLRKEVRDAQVKKSDYEKNFSNDKQRLYHIEKTISCIWAKINKIHSEIVHQLSCLIIKIALYNNVDLIKFEDLSWSKHFKKRKVGGWLSYKQIHWFHGQIRDQVSYSAKFYNIKVGVVDARWTSQMCSFKVLKDNFVVTPKMKKKDVDPYISNTKGKKPRNGKRYIFGYVENGNNKTFDLDADLNAARNISYRPIRRFLN